MENVSDSICCIDRQKYPINEQSFSVKGQAVSPYLDFEIDFGNFPNFCEIVRFSDF